MDCENKAASLANLWIAAVCCSSPAVVSCAVCPFCSTAWTTFCNILRIVFSDDKMCAANAFVFSANTLTSWATMANPFPASPARDASIDAFNASKFVCLNIY